MDSTQNLLGFLADSSQNSSRHAYLINNKKNYDTIKKCTSWELNSQHTGYNRGLYHAPVIPAESGGIWWNHFWQAALPKLPFQGPIIPVELSHSGIETRMVPEWIRTESGGMQKKKN